MVLERLPERRTLVVLDSVLLANRLHVGRQLPQVAVVHRREQVVLSLQVEAPSEEECEVAIGSHIVGSDYLVFIVIRA